jgi:hypothetical protein
MNRFASAGCAVAAGLLFASSPQLSAAPDARSLPMQFELWTEGPAPACGEKCRTWVSASGAITADTPREFEAFTRGRRLEGLTIALDSDGGSVLGALALGRSIRRLGMITTVGRTVGLSANDDGRKRAKLQPRAFCESMCAFVLLAGVERRVPAEARVMVHQIWLGDRRDDPTAANYSAEDLVVVQRDIGRLAQYTVEMGGGIDLLEIALKIPPWEPMRQLSRDELRNMKVMTSGDSIDTISGPTTNSVALSNGARAAVNSRAWAMLAGDSRPALGRSHPLTVEGDDLGTFDLVFACGEQGRDLVVTYSERRRDTIPDRVPAALTEVEISVAGRPVPLKIVSSRASDRAQGAAAELVTLATGRLPLELLQNFAERNGRSMTVETVSDDASTVIRVGNAGIARVLPSLSAGCAAAAANHARIRSSARTAARQADNSAQPR